MYKPYKKMKSKDTAMRTDVINPENWARFKTKARNKGWTIVTYDILPNGRINVTYKEKR